MGYQKWTILLSNGKKINKNWIINLNDFFFFKRVSKFKKVPYANLNDWNKKLHFNLIVMERVIYIEIKMYK